MPSRSGVCFQRCVSRRPRRSQPPCWERRVVGALPGLGRGTCPRARRPGWRYPHDLRARASLSSAPDHIIRTTPLAGDDARRNWRSGRCYSRCLVEQNAKAKESVEGRRLPAREVGCYADRLSSERPAAAPGSVGRPLGAPDTGISDRALFVNTVSAKGGLHCRPQAGGLSATKRPACAAG